MKKLFSLTAAVILFTTLAVSAGCSNAQAEGVPFKIIVIPQELHGNSIAGQQCVFLITITEDGKENTVPVEISATASGAVITIYKNKIMAGEVSEVAVVPEQSSIDKNIELLITGTRGNLKETETVSFQVIEGQDDRAEYATELRDKFTSWLEVNHPELGITPDTDWSGTMVSPQWLIVSHYLFFSDEWEMHVAWHIMIAPYDWARIELRHRFDETAPTYAFEISSLSGNTSPIAIEVPEEVWR